MKTFAIAAATLLAAAPFASVTAATLDPMTYGTVYCSARRSGLNLGDASERAAIASIDHDRKAIKTNDGVDLDVKLSSQAVKILCPEY